MVIGGIGDTGIPTKMVGYTGLENISPFITKHLYMIIVDFHFKVSSIAYNPFFIKLAVTY